jgi:Flp pilus assembly protein TadG
MAFRTMSRLFVLLAITILFAIQVSAQTAATTASTATAPKTTTSTNDKSTSTRSRSSAATAGAPPDVYLNVPELHVGRIELTVEDLQADINLNAKVANLVQLNAGVQIGIKKVNITIAEVDAQVELVVRLGMCYARH